jgi:hypothetical protein
MLIAGLCAHCARHTGCSKKWTLDDEITTTMSISRDYDELTYVWWAWHNATKSCAPLYEQFVALSNKGAQAGAARSRLSASCL